MCLIIVAAIKGQLHRKHLRIPALVEYNDNPIYSMFVALSISSRLNIFPR